MAKTKIEKVTAAAKKASVQAEKVTDRLLDGLAQSRWSWVIIVASAAAVFAAGVRVGVWWAA